MFNSSFYPTPKEIVEQTLFGIDVKGTVVLEPHGGSGNAIDVLHKLGAKEVLTCEIHPDLSRIARSKADRFLMNDFLQVKSGDISHIDLIWMNPPFAGAEQHINHAFSIAPDGCTIVALCNWQTLDNDYTSSRKRLLETIENFGSKENLSSVFSSSERPTNVQIGLVKLYKPKSECDNEFEGYFDLSEEYEQSENGIMKYNEIVDIVNRYVGALKMFTGVINQSKELNSLINPINLNNGYGGNITFGAFQSRNSNLYPVTRDEFKKALQKNAWSTVFSKMDMRKYVTTKVMDEINKFVENQTKVPFTVKNVYKMIEMIVGTHGSRMDKVLTQAFDEICSFSAENSEAGEKWKTNSNYKVNQKFIKPYICRFESYYHDNRLRTSHSAYDAMNDILKALCYMTGTKYEDCRTLDRFCSDINMEWGKWYSWGFFEIRGYKKGTMHFKFQDEKVWMEFNRRVAKIKEWQLPTNTNRKTKGTERTQKQGLEIFETV